METIKISKEKAEEIQCIYDRKYSIENLCILLSSKNELVEEGNEFYERLIKDNMSCMKQLENFWNGIKEKYNINLKSNEELFLIFYTGEIALRTMEHNI